MVKISSIILIILNIAMFAFIAMLIYNSSAVLNTFGIPHESKIDEGADEDTVEGFSYRRISLSPHQESHRTNIQTFGYL